MNRGDGNGAGEDRVDRDQADRDRADSSRADEDSANDDNTAEAWVDWHALERSLPLDDLPRFHRAFLAGQQPGVDWQAAALRQVQGKVQAALKRLEREGLARQEGERLFVTRKVLPEGYPEGQAEGDEALGDEALGESRPA